MFGTPSRCRGAFSRLSLWSKYTSLVKLTFKNKRQTSTSRFGAEANKKTPGTGPRHKDLNKSQSRFLARQTQPLREPRRDTRTWKIIQNVQNIACGCRISFQGVRGAKLINFRRGTRVWGGGRSLPPPRAPEAEACGL